MENPLNPPESQDPLDNQNPLEDPLLDALEQSIEGPPGSVDPLVENDKQFMDGLARQLDEVEASIENAQPVPPEPEVTDDRDELNSQGDEFSALETTSFSEGNESPQAMNDLEETIQNPLSFDSQGSDSDEHKFEPPLPKPKRGGGGHHRRRRPRYLLRRVVKRTGSLISRRNSQPRFCPENHKLIDKQKCESCEKYRHWPKGTNEEPKKCWYDWQAKQAIDESDDGSDEGR